MALSMIFGMTKSSVSMYLRFGRRLVIRILTKEPDAAIKIPSIDKICEYQASIAAKHPSLEGVWCTMDGLKLYLEQSGDAVIQNMFYNGWTHDHYVSAVFVFCPDGTIPIAAYNMLGCFHDSTIAEWGKIYEKLGRVYEMVGGKCTVDSAFSKKTNPFLIKSSQTDPDTNDANDYVVNTEATAMRQSGFSRRFHVSRIDFSTKNMENRIIFKFMLLLYNVRARRVGINQIRNTYMAYLHRDVNEEFVVPLLNNE